MLDAFVSAIAIIPARGGSKRIPRKNVRSFLGRPILEYGVAAALEAGIFDEVMVSSDDEEIADIARAAGAQVPFLRSAATSDDHSTTAHVVEEVIADYARLGRSFDFACCIYPTAPFITASKLREAFGMLKRTGADVVLPIAPSSFPIWCSFREEGDQIRHIWPEHAAKRSQDLEQSYEDAG